MKQIFFFILSLALLAGCDMSNGFTIAGRFFAWKVYWEAYFWSDLLKSKM